MVKRLAILCAASVAILVSILPAADQGKGDAAKGKSVFSQCMVCHATDGTTQKMGPNLKGLFHKAQLRNGKPLNEANVTAVLKQGGKGMPPFAEVLSAKDMSDVVAYLKTL